MGRLGDGEMAGLCRQMCDFYRILNCYLSTLVTKRTFQITVTGLVQGVGFRPFVHRIATREGLDGWVMNTNENVIIRISGASATIHRFVVSLREEAPAASMIEDIDVRELEPETIAGFSIRHSHDVSDDITEISPDIAVCDECLGDMKKTGTRLDYAFVNCTNCGPRFTIIRDLPYDRDKTTMQPFAMCPECHREYETITDRRFHAQPTACSVCGPNYELYAGGAMVTADIRVILHQLASCLDQNGTALIKGLGGMHLACNAFSETAVAKLRSVKRRDGKPFAVMFRDLASLRQFAMVDQAEEQSLRSWRRPIVLLKLKTGAFPAMAGNVNAGLGLLGVMLPYMPFHHLLFSYLDTPAIVLTSGNFSREPILTGNQAALSSFAPLVDAVILHNRDIFNRTDDSVVRVFGGIERVLRRSRGYVPAPVRTAMNTGGILAFGAELTNCFCIGKGKKAFLSQHIGDLQGLETTEFYEETIARFLKLFRMKPELLAVDLHPDYISTRTAMKYGDLPVVRVQHHHAHIASCMAEHHLDERVIGVAFDGTGYGDDGHTWGSEFLVCDLLDFTRISHFEYLPMPGGDRATEEPWRMAVSLLYHVYGDDIFKLGLPLFDQVGKEKIRMAVAMIDRKINCPLTSGAGRLFDAVAAVMGLCHTASFQAEGPMRLESLVREGIGGSYPFNAGETISFARTIRAIADDLAAGLDLKIIASKFHNTIISVIFESVKTIRSHYGISKVVLSGGVFQNKYLLEGTATLLRENSFDVYTHASIPANDGGIALGQLAVASKRRDHSCV